MAHADGESSASSPTTAATPSTTGSAFTADDDFPVGNIRSKYEINDEELIGEGAFGRVVKGRCKDTDQTVAIKMLNKRAIKDKDSILMERKILRAAKHGNIVNLIDSLQDDHTIYFVLELAGGGELFKYIQKFGIEEMPKLAPRFIGEVVLALQYLHEQGILHRDIKPENMLLTSDYHVKLADFGTAIFEAQEEQNFTGTPDYVSPEVLQKSKASRASDLWALGCTVYQLYVGRPPFSGESQYLLFQSIMNRELTYPPYFPEKVRDLVDRLLELDPENRLGSRSYDDLKGHPFFEGVEWEKLLSLNNVTMLNKDHTAEWKSFLLKGERVILTATVKKTRRMLSIKKRTLILTDYPRLFYLNKKKQIKGKVPWTADMWAEVVTDQKFLVHTPNRIYEFDCLFENQGESAGLWAWKINSLLTKK